MSQFTASGAYGFRDESGQLYIPVPDAIAVHTGTVSKILVDHNHDFDPADGNSDTNGNLLVEGYTRKMAFQLPKPPTGTTWTLRSALVELDKRAAVLSANEYNFGGGGGSPIDDFTRQLRVQLVTVYRKYHVDADGKKLAKVDAEKIVHKDLRDAVLSCVRVSLNDKQSKLPNDDKLDADALSAEIVKLFDKTWTSHTKKAASVVAAMEIGSDDLAA